MHTSTFKIYNLIYTFGNNMFNIICQDLLYYLHILCIFISHLYLLAVNFNRPANLVLNIFRDNYIIFKIYFCYHLFYYLY